MGLPGRSRCRTARAPAYAAIMRRPALPVGCIALIFLGRGCATNILATDRAEAVDRVSGVLWRRGSDYATLTFAQDLSSVFTYGNVTLLGSRPAGGPHTPKQVGLPPHVFLPCLLARCCFVCPARSFGCCVWESPASLLGWLLEPSTSVSLNRGDQNIPPDL